MPDKKIYPRNQLSEIVQQLKADGKVVVTTNGCFDVLHVGHLRYLQAAQALRRPPRCRRQQRRLCPRTQR